MTKNLEMYEQKSSKSSILSQTWDGDVLGCIKNVAVIQLPLESGLAVQT